MCFRIVRPRGQRPAETRRGLVELALLSENRRQGTVDFGNVGVSCQNLSVGSHRLGQPTQLLKSLGESQHLVELGV